MGLTNIHLSPPWDIFNKDLQQHIEEAQIDLVKLLQVEKGKSIKNFFHPNNFRKLLISNGNRTEWCTIQGVIKRVI